ncbi:phospho-2-dehydro-3-deoxyheptonate aldolase [Sulfolobus islandicus Y.G.57.14]|jgi:3-deoxy-7-phosphoheptulonate synthase|uniref:3-deoxy-D-arabino-heptulosonate 7-phosphate (DAHP) synthase n=9 Tax=Saccharolobus islandicus TaxID=43080 RepID=M9U814_SACIS|nr:3-deoxy-7-phosphoheptulonate synthase [Sulfolobus islandicus]ACP35933.1 phospho-2-dehydro-3-deoxyheptonate aldolase [Sulfolobus islandicus L.S.2.15]ACP46171.1 phospho-2-dehydro-3-deoxyheptonate aldolase [Sulfolobus islandicus Y.G.57.14]ACP48117.1 phospho-2-dehydro-3-deoxyheptonate aldolase [Sulfolobus islandicus Y.N.15.51]ACP55787.1 phospho-2-dehydro-3-deoxyheptonate aldolase [Sulfolobus islandicus M.16.27]ACR42449.1 phospho-2-dehydro-3-deoxyheptonate aldolase [Sulfolobus islandicus M.16.4]
MILYVLKDKSDYSTLVEKLNENSASFKVLNLYGKNLVLAWPDQNTKGIIDSSIEIAVEVKKSYVLASNDWKKQPTVVNVKDVEIGSKKVIVAAGPCAVESEEQVLTTAKAVKRAGASLLRGGAYKPRTSPYSFQGIGEEGVKILRRVGDEVGLPIVTEIMDTRDSTIFTQYVDMIQIGARNAQNFSLLKEVGKLGKPVLLKRGMGNTVEEWLQAAEYILLEGNGNTVLCERGIRTFEKSTRFTLDIGGMVAAKLMTHLPICADPSHPAGKRELVHSLALAAVAAGADMLLVEVHPHPEKALSDSEQQLTPESFEVLMDRIRALARALGRDA